MANRHQVALTLTVFFAVAVSAVGVAAATVYIRSLDSALLGTRDLYEVQTLDVPVMARTLGAGTVITDEDLETVEMGADYVSVHVVTARSALIGRTAAERLLVGEMVRAERLAPAEAQQGLAAIIPHGMRAVSLNLRDGEAVSGFIVPGAAVDLLVTLPADDEAQRPSETVTLEQTVLVLAVDEKISETAAGEEIKVPQVTLAIRPEEVERVTHALSVGQPKLTLRAVIDLHHQETHGALVEDLLGKPLQRVSAAEYHERVSEADMQRMLEIIRGPDKSLEPIVNPALLEELPPLR